MIPASNRGALFASAVALLAIVLPVPAEEGRSTRREALRGICERLDIGEGAVVADIGCGKGTDTVTLASVVGRSGTVFGEEIDAERLKDLRASVERAGLPQVVPVLGQSDDPRLPDGSCDLIFMHRVFHHFAKPREMLRSMLADLKPGGHLVIVDQQRGALTRPVDLSSREKKHNWTAETVVVRLAREEGLLFLDAPDGVWWESAPFVLIFQRPMDTPAVGGDPRAPPPIADVPTVIDALGVRTEARDGAEGAVLVCALDQGRGALAALKDAAGPEAEVHDLILTEWVTAPDEAPPSCEGWKAMPVRFEKGEPKVDGEVRYGAVLFADAYHRLLNPAKLIAWLGPRLVPGARVVVVDQSGPVDEPRRLAGHRRRIAPARVLEDLRPAGLRPVAPAASLGCGRFLLSFERVRDAEPATGARLPDAVRGRVARF